MENGEITQTKNKTNKGERDYTDEALALLNHLKESNESVERGKEVLKGEWETVKLRRPKIKQNGGEGDYTYEALALLNHLKPLMNLCKALMSALAISFIP